MNLAERLRTRAKELEALAADYNRWDYAERRRFLDAAEWAIWIDEHPGLQDALNLIGFQFVEPQRIAAGDPDYGREDR